MRDNRAMGRVMVPLTMALLVGACVSTGGEAVRYPPRWEVDTKKGCKYWNPDPWQGLTASWQGECADGYADGRGVLTYYMDGGLNSKFEGEMKKGKSEGSGEFYWYDKCSDCMQSYVGDFKNGARHGKGLLTWHDGVTYEGDFVDGERHGKGTLNLLYGRNYAGDFVHNKRIGQGVFTYSLPCNTCLTKYVGGFFEGREHGYGVAEYGNGDSYKGEWRNGKPVGLTVFQARAKEREAAEARAAAERARVAETNRQAQPAPSYSAPVSVPLLDYRLEVTCRVSAFVGKPLRTLVVPLKLQYAEQYMSVMTYDQMTELCKKHFGSDYYRSSERILY